MNNTRNEIKAQIIRAGFTMQEVCDRLHDDYGWSDSVSNLSNKLQRESIRYREVVELADVLGYDLKWVPKETNRSLGEEQQRSEREFAFTRTRVIRSLRRRGRKGGIADG